MEIRENGDFVTNGQLSQVVQSLQNTRVSTYATTSTETIVQLAGTATMHNGIARITFENVDPEFNDIISPDEAYRVLVTPNGVTGQLYVTDRSNAGFIIRDASDGDGVSVDWLVLAYRHDLVPEHVDAPQDDVPNEEVEEELSEGETLPEEEAAPSEEEPVPDVSDEPQEDVSEEIETSDETDPSEDVSPEDPGEVSPP